VDASRRGTDRSRDDQATANIEIDFAALRSAHPKAVSIRYMLEGYDAGWNDPGARRQAFYTNLPPRDYRFRVIAQRRWRVESRGRSREL
jgi:hypothetical protein